MVKELSLSEAKKKEQILEEALAFNLKEYEAETGLRVVVLTVNHGPNGPSVSVVSRI